ncbi:uncharacterized protein LOC122087445 isoform X2 [Macadamia integrifolia]|nr:uncharacterized protein LOC122087445 isoform X2 [Macadamia integrifolia]XP_042512525.1 uncharacterized protein LOC122087445 isoform X2 [Macadamia integrifolia]
MTLLELVTKAAADPSGRFAQSQYPIILNADDILCILKPKNEDSNNFSLFKRVSGWQISATDSEIIALGSRFCKKLKKNLKNKTFDREECLGLLNSFLEETRKKVGISCGVDPSDLSYTRVMIEKLGVFIAQDVSRLVLEACLQLELWELLETLISQGLVGHSSSTFVLQSLIDAKRSDLICLCIKHFSDFQSSDLISVLKFFLSPQKEAFGSMVKVREEWESQALLAIEKVASENLTRKKSNLAKQASVLLMIAHDGFSTSELCLHYLFASSNLDELTLSSSISRLDGSEMSSLIRYMGKWLRKYERFPQAGLCPTAAVVLGLKACDWVPSLESIVKYLGLVLDEHFSSLVLYSEFHEELRSMEVVVKSLAMEASLCCSVANVIENLRTEVGQHEGA